MTCQITTLLTYQSMTTSKAKTTINKIKMMIKIKTTPTSKLALIVPISLTINVSILAF